MPFGCVCGFSLQLDPLPRSTLPFSHHISELAARIGLCQGWTGEAATHPSRVLASLPQGGTPSHTRLCRATKRPWVSLRTGLAFVFILLGAGCVTLGKRMPSLSLRSSVDAHPLEGL